MDQKLQIAERIKQANNILVTVSNNPSVDQLAACIGLTLTLNKMGKHATAVFSGAVPSTIEFLQPEKTLEPNTDSLRDFIISLDKAKADKLRYKVEDKVVKIFITPYRTSISDKDLEFSQGDFNVDIVVALGVHNQTELDQAITTHGRILHDATVATLNIKPGGELGSINWMAPGASSLSELVVDLIDAMDRNLLDSQIATAFLTGIVAETARFSNSRTSPDTMSVSAELMAAGANQQLVATKLEPPKPKPAPAPVQVPAPMQPQKVAEAPAPAAPPEPPKPDDGTLEISHDDKQSRAPLETLETSEDSLQEEKLAQIHIDEQGGLHSLEEIEAKEKESKDASTDPTGHLGSSRMILQPPTMGGAMSGNAASEEGFTDPLSLPRPDGPSLDQPGDLSSPFAASPVSANITPPSMPFMPPSMTPGGSAGSVVNPIVPPTGTPQPPVPVVPDPPQEPDDTHVDNARNAVMEAIATDSTGRPEPIHALNAHPLGDVLHSQPQDNMPPDLNVPVPADAPLSGSPSLNIPSPAGSPPPGPPPMMPLSPQ